LQVSLMKQVKHMLEAKIDGFRCYKIKNRGDVCTDGRKYIAPVYVIGLPGDVDNFNKDLKMSKGECLEF